MGRRHHDKHEKDGKDGEHDKVEKENHRHKERHHRRDRDLSKKRHRQRGNNKFTAFFKAFGMVLLGQFLAFFHILLDKFLEYCLGQYWGARKVCPPLDGDQFVTKSAVELAKLIREKKLKSYDVVKAYIERMQTINVLLNAVVDGPFLEALDEAKAIDKRIEDGTILEDEFIEKPFLGVPFTTKDSTAVNGKLHTLGLLSRKDCRCKEDAECVRLMKEAGCIIIATSNVPEVNKWIESRNMLIGQTNNPYDHRRSVGGSSGGEGALIASCATAFGLGTDIGGSIRIPAFNCGVFGHKPTQGVVNMKGCTFRTGEETSTMVVAGPMGRYATDLLPIMKILCGPKNAIALKLDEKIDLKSLKYYYMPSNNMVQCNPVNKETQAIMTKITQHFTQITGDRPTLAQLPGIEHSNKLWRHAMFNEPSDFNALLGDGVALNPFVELAKKLLGQSQFTMAAIYSLIDSVLPKDNAEAMDAITKRCSEALEELLGDDGVLFFHSSPRTAPFHYYPLVKFTDFNYFSIFNVLKVPATQVPMGLDSNGLPLGIQVIAGRNCDRLCFAVAEELEKTFGGWVAPFANKQ